MRSRVISLLALAVVAAPLIAEDKPDVAKLKKDLAAAEAKVAELKGELAKAEGEPSEFKDVGLLRLDYMKVGECGRLAYSHDAKFQKVVEILGSDTALLAFDEEDRRKGRVVAKGFPTKDYVDGKSVVGPDDKPQYWGVVGTTRRGQDTLFVVRPVPAPQNTQLVADPKAKPDPKADKKPEAKPLPKVTLTPTKGEPVTLGSAGLILSTAKKEPAQRDKWLKEGQLLVLTNPTEVEVVSRDKEFTRISLAGKEWVVESRCVPAESK